MGLVLLTTRGLLESRTELDILVLLLHLTVYSHNKLIPAGSLASALLLHRSHLTRLSHYTSIL